MSTSQPGTPSAGTAPCPCNPGAAYAACCSRYHAGPLQLQAPDAPALMRSRYSAYVLGLHGYLLDTWHPRTRPASLPPPEPGLHWLGLQLLRQQATAADAAVVEFVARSKLGGRAHRLHETSRFMREAGRWFYLDGELK